jgi:predicted transcriptional regulator
MATPQILGNSPESFPFIGEAKAKHTSPRPLYREEEDIQPYTKEELNAMLDRSLEDIRAGRTVSHEEVKKRIAAWLSK